MVYNAKQRNMVEIIEVPTNFFEMKGGQPRAQKCFCLVGITTVWEEQGLKLRYKESVLVM